MISGTLTTSSNRSRYAEDFWTSARKLVASANEISRDTAQRLGLREVRAWLRRILERDSLKRVLADARQSLQGMHAANRSAATQVRLRFLPKPAMISCRLRRHKISKPNGEATLTNSPTN
jgi:hypothetical protein